MSRLLKLNENHIKHKNHIRSLYKLCLSMARESGWKPGDTRENTYIQRNFFKMKYNKKKIIIENLKQEDLGAYIAFNIRKMFKDSMNLNEESKINDSIDYGYHFVRNMPKYCYPLQKEYLEDLHLYNSHKKIN